MDGRKEIHTFPEKRFFKWVADDVSVSIRSRSGSYGGGSEVLMAEDNNPEYVVRRLTPMECERLQGYEDGWTDIGEYESKGKKKQTSDSDRYKALGNSIATVAWTDILHSIAEHCAEKTMCSLFDGIGGFPLIWERDCGGTTLWQSEIEDYCNAVTENRFPLTTHSQTVKAEREREREREVEPQTVGTIVKEIAKQVGNTQDSTMVAEVIFNKAEGFDAYNQKSTGG